MTEIKITDYIGELDKELKVAENDKNAAETNLIFHASATSILGGVAVYHAAKGGDPGWLGVETGVALMNALASARVLLRIQEAGQRMIGIASNIALIAARNNE